jgi:type I restriction enzyme S subunit
MSRLDELIAELCPDGVEYIKLGGICNLITTGKLNANAMVENGKYPFFTCDANPYRINEYAFDTTAIIISGNGSQVGHINFYQGKFNAYQRTYVLSEFNNIDVKYLLHYLKGNLKNYIILHSKKGSVPYITMPMLKNFSVPIPPLPVQQEIVRILDNFTELTAELTTELEARKKQYEYYRDKLLTFGNDVSMVKLGDIATDMYRGSGIKRDEITTDGTPCVRYGEIYTTYNIWFDTCVSNTYKGTKTFEHGDILFAITGESVEDIAKSCAYMGHETCFAGGDIVVMKHNQNPKYIAYALSTSDAQVQKSKGKVKSKVVHTSIPALKEIQIPVPSLEEQERIVAILDRFDALCNDLTSGLPAEIEARQKQYEYYRDKLLTFKELGS